MPSLTQQHEITVQDCDERIRLFFNGDLPALQTIPGPDLQEEISTHTADPTQWEVRLTANPDNHMDNKDIQWAVVPHGDNPPGDFSVAYSVALFLDLFKQYSPIAQIGFSKAISAGKNDIVFKVDKGGNTVYCGDMTQIWP